MSGSRLVNCKTHLSLKREFSFAFHTTLCQQIHAVKKIWESGKQTCHYYNTLDASNLLCQFPCPKWKCLKISWFLIIRTIEKHLAGVACWKVEQTTKRDNYTPKHKKFKLVGMNLCSMSVCSVFCQWVGVTCLCLLSFVLEGSALSLVSRVMLPGWHVPCAYLNCPQLVNAPQANYCLINHLQSVYVLTLFSRF